MRSKLRWLQITTIRHLKMHVLLLAVFQENKNEVQLVLGETNHPSNLVSAISESYRRANQETTTLIFHCLSLQSVFQPITAGHQVEFYPCLLLVELIQPEIRQCLVKQLSRVS